MESDVKQSDLELRRAELHKLIQPELIAIMRACTEIELKVGVPRSVEREAAMQLAVTCALSSFTNVPCAIIGWSEFGANQSFNSASYAVSYANDAFLRSNLDAILSFLLSNLTDRIGVEQFELVELVQNRRMALLAGVKK